MKKIRFILVWSSLFAVAACALYRPNVEICADEGRFGASCDYTRDAQHRDLNKDEWDLIRMNKMGNGDAPYFCMAPASLGKYQKFVEDECVITKRCQDQPPLHPALRTKKSKVSIKSLTQVTIPNVEICADEAELGAFCKYTRSQASRTLTKAQWDAIRVGWFCMEADALSEYQSFVMHACNQQKNCIDQVNQTLRTLSILKQGSYQKRKLMSQKQSQNFFPFPFPFRNR